jgi:hypothetical protein
MILFWSLAFPSGPVNQGFRIALLRYERLRAQLGKQGERPVA